jgi:uncharacterized membrane protein
MDGVPASRTGLGVSFALCTDPIVPLSYLDGYGPTSEANAITPDGSKIVGYSTTSLTENQACLWTSSNLWFTGSITPLPGMQNCYNNSAIAISADGNVIAGLRLFGGTEEAFYYTPANQIHLVPFLPSATVFHRLRLERKWTGNWGHDCGGVGEFSVARRFHRVGAGANTTTGKGVAFKWTTTGGVVALPNPTTGYYAIDGATAIRVSRDGRVIVGYGVNAAGNDEAIF